MTTEPFARRTDLRVDRGLTSAPEREPFSIRQHAGFPRIQPVLLVARTLPRDQPMNTIRTLPLAIGALFFLHACGSESTTDPGSGGDPGGGEPQVADDGDPCSARTPCAGDLVCLGSTCQPDPADGAEGLCADGEQARASCEPVRDLCAGVLCGPNETCFAGSCVPGCYAQPGPDVCGGGAGAEACAGGQHWSAAAAACVDTTPCDGACPDGTVCHLTCAEPPAPDACDGVVCDAGSVCVAGLCIEDLCAGVTCTGTEMCVNGSCVDSCDCGRNGCDVGECCVFGRCEGGEEVGDGGGGGGGGGRGEGGGGDCVRDCPVDGVCGADDGCGGVCTGGKCPDETNLCIDAECYCPGCSEDADCGADDGCGNACPIGKCDPGRICIRGLCECDPVCSDDAECGADDGCGGTCDGDCPAGQRCERDHGVHSCQCAPDCGGNVACGADDGCGGTCDRGDCPAGETCDHGACVPDDCGQSCGCGETCVAGACLPLCSADETQCGCNTCCAGGVMCVAGVCAEGPE